MMTIACLVAAALAGALAMTPFPVFGQSRYEGSVWKGTITFTYREAGGDKSTNSRNQIDREEQWSLSNRFTLILNVCGNSLEQAYVKNAFVDYTHTWKNKEIWPKAVCLDTKEVKKPGFRTSEEGSMSAVIHPNLVGSKADAALAVSLQPSGGIRYTISAGLGLDAPMALLVGSSQSKQYDPCENTTVSHTLEYTAGLDNARQKCSNDGKTCHSLVPAGETAFPMTFSHAGTSTGPCIAGKMTIPVKKMGAMILSSLASQMEEMARQMPEEIRSQMMGEIKKIEKESSKEISQKSGSTDTKGKTTAALDVVWNLRKNDPCDAVLDQLRQELSMVQAYADTSLLSKARREGWTGEQYDNAVFENGKAQYASGWWKNRSSRGKQGNPGKPSDGDHNKHIDMALNNERCEIVGQEEKQKALRQDCMPQIIYESILEHEKTHAKQCMSKDTAAEFASRTPDSFRKFEQAAYCVGAKKLMKWAEGVCTGSDVKPLREMYEQFCPK